MIVKLPGNGTAVSEVVPTEIGEVGLIATKSGGSPDPGCLHAVGLPEQLGRFGLRRPQLRAVGDLGADVVER